MSIPGGLGHTAYASRQADLLDKMGAQFLWMWGECCTHANGFLLSHNIPIELETRVLAEDDEFVVAAQNMSRAAEGRTGQDEDDEELWGVSAGIN